jgi:hypothetical protein
VWVNGSNIIGGKSHAKFACIKEDAAMDENSHEKDCGPTIVGGQPSGTHGDSERRFFRN